jgi:1,4-alpha-glucan branching enzyme
MLLTKEEILSLVEVKSRSPHALLGLHPLSDGTGLVARAFQPDAAKVELQPVHEKDKPAIKLKRIHNAGLFEGLTKDASRVYSYDLLITDLQGRVRRTRDPYSFLPTLEEADLYLFGKGDERRIYDKLGAQLRVIDGIAGASFAVWAPSAQRVSVVGDFNQWDGRRHQMRSLGSSGVWEIFVPGVAEGAQYKYEIRSVQGYHLMKTDPYGFHFETPPRNNSIVWNNRKFEWTDEAWLAQRPKRDPLRSPLSIYEVHLGSHIASWPRCSSSTSRKWGSHMSNSCLWPNTRTTHPGATRSPVFLRRPAGMAHRRIFNFWSMNCMRRASAS